jgi:hypothetical protein
MPIHQLLKLGIGKGVDWRKDWMGDTNVPSHPDMPDVIVGFHKNLNQW